MDWRWTGVGLAFGWIGVGLACADLQDHRADSHGLSVKPQTHASPALHAMADAATSLALASYLLAPTNSSRAATYAARAELVLDAWFLNQTSGMLPNGDFAQGIPGQCRAWQQQLRRRLHIHLRVLRPLKIHATA